MGRIDIFSWKTAFTASQGKAIFIVRKTSKLVDAVRTMQNVLDGKVIDVNVTVAVPVLLEMTIPHDPKTLEVQSPDGK